MRIPACLGRVGKKDNTKARIEMVIRTPGRDVYFLRQGKKKGNAGQDLGAVREGTDSFPGGKAADSHNREKTCSREDARTLYLCTGKKNPPPTPPNPRKTREWPFKALHLGKKEKRVMMGFLDCGKKEKGMLPSSPHQRLKKGLNSCLGQEGKPTPSF